MLKALRCDCCMMWENGAKTLSALMKLDADQTYPTADCFWTRCFWVTKNVREHFRLSDVVAENNLCKVSACNLDLDLLFRSVTFKMRLSSLLFFALRFADSIRGMLKLILVLMFAGASLAATWFTLTCLSRLTHLPSTKGTMCWKDSMFCLAPICKTGARRESASRAAARASWNCIG